MDNKIIAFSLWGKSARYTQGMIANAELAKIVYPDWRVRVYVGSDVKIGYVENLLSLKCEIVQMSGCDWLGMFWRFLAADGDSIMLSRDADSRLTFREKSAVDEWLSSDKDFHIMRDHQYHGVPILGGMWGCRNGVIKGITGWIDSYNKENRLGIDQDFLKDIVYPKVKTNSCVHDPFYEKRSFPRHFSRNDRHFVGQAYDGDGRILDGTENFAVYMEKEYGRFCQRNDKE